MDKRNPLKNKVTLFLNLLLIINGLVCVELGTKPSGNASMNTTPSMDPNTIQNTTVNSSEESSMGTQELSSSTETVSSAMSPLEGIKDLRTSNSSSYENNTTTIVPRLGSETSELVTEASVGTVEGKNEMKTEVTSTTAGGSGTTINILKTSSTTLRGLVRPTPVMEPSLEGNSTLESVSTSGQVEVPTGSSTLTDRDFKIGTVTTPPTSLNGTNGSHDSVDDGKLKASTTEFNTMSSTPASGEKETPTPKPEGTSMPKRGSDSKANGSDSFGMVILKIGSGILIAAFVIFSVLKTWSICTGNSAPVKCACFDCIFNAVVTVFGAMWKLLKICCRRISPRSNLSATRGFSVSRSELLASDELDNYYAL